MGAKIVLLIIVLVIVGAVVASVSYHPNLAVKNSNQQNLPVESPIASGSATPSVPTPTESSINDLLASTKPEKCSFNDQNVSWTLYVGNGKLRMDSAGGHMIYDNRTAYYWSDSGNLAFKYSTSQASSSASLSQSAPNLNQTYTYKCQDWVVDPGLLTVPPNINFQSFSATP